MRAKLLCILLLLSGGVYGQMCVPPDYVHHVGDKILCKYPDGNIKWVQYIVWEDKRYDFIRLYTDTQRACVSLYMDPTPGGCVPVHPATANFWVRTQIDAFKFVRVYGDCLFLAGVIQEDVKILYLYVYIAQIDKEYIYLIPDRADCCGGSPRQYILNDRGRDLIKERLEIE